MSSSPCSATFEHATGFSDDIFYGRYYLVIRSALTWLFYELFRAMCGVDSVFTRHRDLFLAFTLCVIVGFCGCNTLFGVPNILDISAVLFGCSQLGGVIVVFLSVIC